MSCCNHLPRLGGPTAELPRDCERRSRLECERSRGRNCRPPKSTQREAGQGTRGHSRSLQRALPQQPSGGGQARRGR